MSTPDPDRHTRALAAAALADGDPTGWFETLYTEASRGEAVVPWDSGTPQAIVAGWAHGRDGTGRTALVVGAGLGRDAELVARLGYATTAFDISSTAIATTTARFPDSAVHYRTADLLDPPPDWRQAFDLVLESLTVQSMPLALRAQAIAGVAGFVAPGGTLVVVASSRPDGTDPDSVEGPPWPLDRAEVDSFTGHGLTPVSVELVGNTDDGPRRWLAEFTR